ncbi:hypothetical protein ACWGOK_41805, partial [Streptomyces eurythermus]
MTRRSILRGIAAAPFVGVAGTVLAPGTAQAATIDPAQFALTARTANSYGEFAALNAGLATKLTSVDATAVLADTNRKATRLTSAPGTSEAFEAGFTWDSGDQDVDYWIPQGVTTSADAYGNGVYPEGGSNKAVLVSWYFETNPDGTGADDYPLDKGLRLTFVNYNSASAPTYRHVLLVEPVKTAGGEFSFNPIRKHAGGILWYGNLLYVVDTFKGLRVFDLNTLFQVDTTQQDSCGLPALLGDRPRPRQHPGQPGGQRVLRGRRRQLHRRHLQRHGRADHDAQGGALEPRLHHPQAVLGHAERGGHGGAEEDPGRRLPQQQALPLGQHRPLRHGRPAH